VTRILDNFIRGPLFYYSVLLFFFILPINQYWSIRILVLSTILSLFVYSPEQLVKKVFRTSWDVLLYVLILLIGFLYSKDLNVAFRVMETSISILLLPLVFSKINLSTRYINSIYFYFIMGLFCASLVCIGHSGIRYKAGGDGSVFFFEELTKGIGFQPTYMAYYLCFALTVSLYFMYYKKTGASIYIQIGIQILFFVILMLTEGRTAYVSMLFIFSFFILKYIFEDAKVNSQRLTFVMSILFMIGMLAINQYNFNVGSEPINGDYWERLSLWKSAVHANVNYLFGVGTGDYKDVLNQYYRTQGMNQYAVESYNSHNQFIQSFFSNGILGLIALMGILARPLYLSFKIQNSLGILIIFPFIIYGMTEVFLGRYQGVVFFASCHQLVISKYYYTRPNLMTAT